MSTFEVPLTKIDKVWDHPNADKLQLASVKGMTYQFCIPKNRYKPGDDIVYFPVDSLLPDEISERIGVKNYLAGSNKDRVKTIKLRGEISQGIVADLFDVLSEEQKEQVLDLSNLAPALGITKYEPPEILIKEGKLKALPNLIEVYDLEGASRYPKVVEALLDEIVLITEKLEGTNHVCARMPDNSIVYCTHRRQIEELEDVPNLYCETARRAQLDKLFDDLDSKELTQKGKTTVIRSEMCGPGIQGNIYKLSKPQVFCFDIEENGKYMDAIDWFEHIAASYIPTVPFISIAKTLREWLDGRSIEEASNGMSLLGNCKREGIVIKPLYEKTFSFEEEFPHRKSRLVLKQRSPEYLAKGDT